MGNKSIAIDMMGSDLGPVELSSGVKRFLNEYKDIDVILYGDIKTLVPLFKDEGDSRVTIVETNDVIPMEIKPLDFLRRKDSSMYQAINAVKEKRCEAVISAGSTGGLVSGATVLLRLIEGISKAGIILTLPTINKKTCVVMDVGANNYCSEEDLYSFAIMARAYHKIVNKVENANISLLSNGTEEGKGTDEIVKAYNYFKEKKLNNFIGNVEASSIMDGKHDVIITPGFTGNILLKSLEGSVKLFKQILNDTFTASLKSKIGYLLTKKGLANAKKLLDYKAHGGACLLGVNGLVVKAHGSSNDYAFYNALKITRELINFDLINIIETEIKNGKD